MASQQRKDFMGLVCFRATVHTEQTTVRLLSDGLLRAPFINRFRLHGALVVHFVVKNHDTAPQVTTIEFS